MSAEATTEHEHRETVLDLPMGELSLRVRGGDDEKLLRLRSSKCTLGASADCTVQIPDGEPLQCVILRGPGGTVVRNLTGQSRLNGQPFSDAALGVGDCLQVGSVEIEVLADCRAEVGASAWVTAASRQLAASDPTAADDAAARPARSATWPGDIHLRFDRLEKRLTSLERMIGELLHLQHQANPSSTAAEAPPTFSPVPEPEPWPPLEAEVQPAAVETAAPQNPSWAEGNDDAELDVSLRAYLERLLGPAKDPDEKPVPATAELYVPAELPTPSPSSESPAQEAEAESPSPPPAQDVRDVAGAETIEEPTSASAELPLLAPLSLPPESELKLDAMREVANLSATAAIRDFEKNQAARKTFDRLPLLLIGVICGLMLLYSALSSGKSGMFVGAGAAFVGAALTAWQLLIVARRWLSASQPVEQVSRNDLA